MKVIPLYEIFLFFADTSAALPHLYKPIALFPTENAIWSAKHNEIFVALKLLDSKEGFF